MSTSWLKPGRRVVVLLFACAAVGAGCTYSEWQGNKLQDPFGFDAAKRRLRGEPPTNLPPPAPEEYRRH